DQFCLSIFYHDFYIELSADDSLRVLADLELSLVAHFHSKNCIHKFIAEF
ncbi:hypothetical protein MAE30S32_48280, partial [Microcystis aeruginosa 11-30S32]